MAIINKSNNQKVFGFLSLGKIILFGAIALIFILSCSKDSSTNPLEDANDNQLLYAELFGTDDIDGLEIIATDSALTSPELNVGIRDSVSFAIEGFDNYIVAPESCVTDSADLSINCHRLCFIRGNDSSLTALAFECTPEGQVFSENLIFDIYPGYFNNNIHSNAVKLYLYNSATKKWNVVSTKQKNDPRLRFNIGHFSKYAISD